MNVPPSSDKPRPSIAGAWMLGSLLAALTSAAAFVTVVVITSALRPFRSLGVDQWEFTILSALAAAFLVYPLASSAWISRLGSNASWILPLRASSRAHLLMYVIAPLGCIPLAFYRSSNEWLLEIWLGVPIAVLALMVVSGLVLPALLVKAQRPRSAGEQLMPRELGWWALQLTATATVVIALATHLDSSGTLDRPDLPVQYQYIMQVDSMDPPRPLYVQDGALDSMPLQDIDSHVPTLARAVRINERIELGKALPLTVNTTLEATLSLDPSRCKQGKGPILLTLHPRHDKTSRPDTWSIETDNGTQRKLASAVTELSLLSPSECTALSQGKNRLHYGWINYNGQPSSTFVWYPHLTGTAEPYQARKLLAFGFDELINEPRRERLR